MPKRVFWPAALVVMGLVLLATVMGYLPSQFLVFWLLVLIIVGLGGLLTSDKEEWDAPKTKKTSKTNKSKSTRSTRTKKAAPSKRKK
ncbi:MAG TPA: hypothetical protein VF209_05095 [Patescibacteria group bacterium]